MYYTIYKTTNIINEKYYIGKHQTRNLEDTYLGSGKALCLAIKKYGKENFKKEILYVFDTEEAMNLKEKEIVDSDFINRVDNYNAGVGGEGGPHFLGKKHTPETIEKIKSGWFPRQIDEAAKERSRLKRTGRIVSDETRVNIAASKLGRPLTDEEKEALLSRPPRTRKRGNGYGDEFKRKMSESSSGRISLKNVELNKNVFVKAVDLDKYLNLGYVRGRIKATNAGKPIQGCGTAASYERGCRCEDCKMAYSNKRKQWASYGNKKS